MIKITIFFHLHDTFQCQFELELQIFILKKKAVMHEVPPHLMILNKHAQTICILKSMQIIQSDFLAIYTDSKK